MFSRLFPRQIDNAYRGPALAIWLLAPVVLVKALMGLNVAGLNPFVSNRFVLRVADSIPIDTYPADAAATVMFLFACWGLALLVLSLLGALVLIRYRAMIPLMCLLLALEQIGRKGLSLLYPVARAVPDGALSSGALINWALSGALVMSLVLSLTVARAPAR